MAATAQTQPGVITSVTLGSEPLDDITELCSALLARVGDTAGLRECVACQEYLAAVLELVRAHVAAVPTSPTPAMSIRLTARERDVLTYLAGGMTARQIARRLEISAATVRKHLEHAYAKLGVHDRLTATIRMRELDLLPP